MTGAQNLNEDLVDKTIERFWETVPHLWGMIRKRLRVAAQEEFGMSVEQFHIMRLVAHGVHSVRELAEHQHVSPPAVSQTVDALAGRGFLTRTQGVEDRRTVRLELTEEGARLMHDLVGRNQRWMAQKMDRLAEDDLKTLIRALELLKECFEAHPDEMDGSR